MRGIFTIIIGIFLIFQGVPATGQYFVSIARHMGSFVGCPCNVKLKTGQELNGESTTLARNKFQIKTDKGEKINLQIDKISSVSFDKTGKKHYNIWLTDESQELLRKDKNLAAKDTFIFEDVEGWGLLQWLNPDFSDKMKVYACEVMVNNSFEDVYEEDEQGNYVQVKEKGKISTSMKFLIVKSETEQVLIDKSNYRGVLAELFSDCPEMLEGFFDEKMRWNDIGRHVFMYTRLCR